MPFTEESLKSVNNTSDTLTSNQIAALEACLKAAHGILDTMLGFDIHVVKTLPMLIFFVRCVYAIVILVKMHVAVSTPNSELGKMMKPDDLRVEYYVDNLIGLFSYVSKEEEFRPHPKILRILNVLRDWFGKHKENIEAQQRGEMPPHPSAGAGISGAGGQDDGSAQTPLQLLSQVATGGNQQVGQDGTQSQDWTFNSPHIINYNKGQVSALPIAQQQQYADAYSIPIDPGMVDPMNPEYGWGTGFEQAMDIALYGTDNMGQSGLDNWFLGDSMAPFQFNGDMGAGQQW